MITDGLQQCSYEYALVVQKDTVINGNLYQKCIQYLTSLPNCSPSSSYLANYVTPVTYAYIREDTISKIILSHISGADDTLINFSLNANDSLQDCSLTNKRVVDSVSVKNYISINRRTTYSSFPGYLGVQYSYETIEGIGTNIGISCPSWGVSLKCYSKNGVELYNSTANSCPKPSPLILQNTVKETFTAQYDGEKIIITNPSLLNIKLEIFDITGKNNYSSRINQNSVFIKTDYLIAGTYIAILTTNRDILRLKFVR